jgi:flavin reductase (DIM6/NTAB) family NADH-FMN oxidoreductase RutF
VAGNTHLVGPFPEDVDPETYDRRRRRLLWALPSGLYVLGTVAGRRRNLMTLNWAMQVAVEPKLLAVSVQRDAVTHGLVQEGGCFSLNLLRREDRALVRKFVKPLDDDGTAGMLAGFPVFEAATGAPILEASAGWLDCSVTATLLCGSHTLFVGEVLDCSDIPDDAEILRMEDTRMNYGG